MSTEANNKPEGVTDYQYNVEIKSMEYTVMGEEIKEDFAFINTTLKDKIDEALNYFLDGSEIDDAFYVENTGAYSDLMHAYEVIKEDVELAKTQLDELHASCIDAIDQVNAELEYNFGHILFCKKVEAKKGSDS